MIPGSGRSPGEGNDNPFQYSCLGKSYGQKSLTGYSPWGRISDRTERLIPSVSKDNGPMGGATNGQEETWR